MAEGLDDETGAILQVHDEATYETPKYQAEYMDTLVRDEMEGAFRIRVPILSAGKYGASWAANK